HLPGGRIDAYDLVGLPHIGPDLAVHTLQLVDHRELLAVAQDRDRPGLLTGLRGPEGERGAAVAHDRAFAHGVVADAPALAVVLHPVDLLQRGRVAPDRVPLPPGQLPHLVTGDREPFPERVVG